LEAEAVSDTSAPVSEAVNDGLLELDEEAEGEVAPLSSPDDGDASDD
jgi:hypothetical protein